MRGDRLWVANAGDSRCVVSRRGRALALTHDHKPTDAAELARISQVRSRCWTLTSLEIHLKQR